MKTKRTIVLSEIKPFGPLESMLNKFDKNIRLCEKEGYTNEVARLCKLLMEFGFLDAKEWFDELKPGEDPREVEMIILCGRMLLIRLNNIAQRDLNGMTMKSAAKQMMSDKELMEYFPNTIFK